MRQGLLLEMRKTRKRKKMKREMIMKRKREMTKIKTGVDTK